MNDQEQPDPPKSSSNELLPPGLFLSVSHPSKPSQALPRRKSLKKTRSQIDQNPLQSSRRLTRLSTATREALQFSSISVYQRFKQDVHLSHKQTESNIYSSHISPSLRTRGLSLIDEELKIYDPIQFSSLMAWLLLVASSISNAMVPCWMTVDIRCESNTRSAWRIFITSLLLIPFVLYEQRNTKVPAQKFWALLNRQNLQKHFIFSMNYSIWVLIGAMALKLTARCHTFALLRLKLFFISIRKFFRREDYLQSEMGGSILVVIGVVMIMWDSYSLPVEENPLAFYLGYSPLSRFCGDLLSIAGSLAILYFQENYSMPKTPRFSNLLLYNICLCINLVTIGYFFGGNEFSFDPVIGVFGLFTRENFVNVFYVSIILGLNLIIGNLLVDKIFSAFIRNVASCFEPIITVSIYHLLSIQVLTPGMASLGLAFIVPGMMLIVGGQNYLKKEEIKINFLIYKEEERRFFDFAKQTLDIRMTAFMAQKQEQGDQDEDQEQSSDKSISGRSADEPSKKDKYD